MEHIKCKHTETYIYTKTDLQASAFRQDLVPVSNDQTSQVYIENVTAPIFSKCCNIEGSVTILNSYRKLNPALGTTTALFSLITPNGLLACNFFYPNGIINTFLPVNKTVKAEASFKSGKYEKFSSVTIEVQALDDKKGTRILTITY